MIITEEFGYFHENAIVTLFTKVTKEGTMIAMIALLSKSCVHKIEQVA